MSEIMISSGDIVLEAELNDCQTARKIWKQLPIEGQANIWGDEIYFEIPVTTDQEPGARAEVDVGELGYWPMGHAFCIFFGPTPVSTDEKPRAYSPVNIIGRVIGEARQLKDVRNGEQVRIERVEI
jgi:hypothetical protein